MGTLAVKGLETGAVIGGLGMALPGSVSMKANTGEIEDHDLSVTGTVFRR